MFEQMLLPSGGTHQGRNTLFALVGELGVVALAAVAMAYFQVLPLRLPEPPIPVYLSPPPPPPPPAAATATRAPVQAAKVVPRTFNIPVPTTPVIVAQTPAMVAGAPPSLEDMAGGGVAGGVRGGVPGGVVGGTLNGVLGAPPSPVASVAPKPAPAAPEPSQIRVGGEVEAALLKHEVMPVYPPIARSARVQGTVRLSASISPSGTVKNLQVLSGNPLLVAAAQDAVKQWTYQPTFLNGKPVEVLTEIDVKFTLG